MSKGLTRGVLVVGHGSRRSEANDDVREAARLIGGRGGFPLVEAAFLEIEHPNIDEAFTALVAKGANSITVHPYFLSPGRHTRGDIPVEVAEAASKHPDVSYQITEPLSAHRLVIEASIERIRETLRTETEPLKATTRNQGAVYLVGAGPGDPGLLTLRAHELLTSCDAVIYDNLVNPELLRYVPAAAERIYVGKIGGGRQTSQHDINRLLIEHARYGKLVVRLKGGDPLLFGRGGEEAEALHNEGIRFEIVPGISSALAVPAYAGIPLTHRGLSASVAVVTGARAGDGEHIREALAAHSQADTVVVLMGVAHLREISSDLIDAGRSPDTPVAVIRWGTYEGQLTVTGTLRSIADESERAGIRSPAVIVVGEVVRLRERLNWFEAAVAGNEDLETALAVA
jgi:uroporphyrin-III C-methyltransferase